MSWDNGEEALERLAAPVDQRASIEGVKSRPVLPQVQPGVLGTKSPSQVLVYRDRYIYIGTSHHRYFGR